MAPVPNHHDSVDKLEAGLLGTLEEEKASLIRTDSQELASKGPHQQQPTPRKMSAIRRLAVAFFVVLYVGLGLALARNAVPCLGAAHRTQDHKAQGHGLTSAIVELVRRQSDGGGSNATSAASVPSAQATSAPASSQAPASPNTTPSDSSTNVPAATSSAPETSSAPLSSASSRAPESSTRDTLSSAASPDTTPASSQADPTTSSQAPLATSVTSTRQASSDSSPSPTSASPTTEQSSAASSDEATTTTSSATSLETITAGEVSTSSAVRKTYTTTLDGGRVKVLTSTSWVAVVPSAAASAKGNSKDADLQNAAEQNRGAITFAAAAGALVAGFVLV